MPFLRLVPEKSRVRVAVNAPRRAWHRPKAVPATGMPVSARRQRRETLISIALHLLLIVALVFRPDYVPIDPTLVERDQGGGGPGPAGGGGGGTGGTGGIKFIKIAPPPTPVVPPPVETPVPPPVIEPPKPVVPEPVIPQMELPKLAIAQAEIKVQSPIIGTGGGTGRDGTTGNGPGTGGGIGTGIGTGRGSGVGPGTGGGAAINYPPSMIEMAIPPVPVPEKLKGTKVIAEFDIDERGKILGIVINGTKDAGYNKKIHDLFKTYRFRPGTTPEGIPIRAKFQLVVEL